MVLDAQVERTGPDGSYSLRACPGKETGEAQMRLD